MTRDEFAAEYVACIARAHGKTPAELLAGKEVIRVNDESPSGDVSKVEVPVTPELVAEAERFLRLRRFDFR